MTPTSQHFLTVFHALLHPTVTLQPPLTDGTFKQASWDWVQNQGDATTKWGDIAKWDVSGVADMSHAFSKHRNAAGGAKVPDGNSAHIASFTGTGLETWITTSLTNMASTFSGATNMNANMAKWGMSKVNTLRGTFKGALKFVGGGMSNWITTALTSLDGTFEGASAMNADVTKWQVDKVTSLSYTFHNTYAFNGIGVNTWKTGLVNDLSYAFSADDPKTVMNIDFALWDVTKVTTMDKTFRNAAIFTGGGLDQWITTSVNNLQDTFSKASAMNADLGKCKSRRQRLLLMCFPARIVVSTHRCDHASL